jgi:hypothetical protein
MIKKSHERSYKINYNDFNNKNNNLSNNINISNNSICKSKTCWEADSNTATFYSEGSPLSEIINPTTNKNKIINSKKEKDKQNLIFWDAVFKEIKREGKGEGLETSRNRYFYYFCILIFFILSLFFFYICYYCYYFFFFGYCYYYCFFFFFFMNRKNYI